LESLKKERKEKKKDPKETREKGEKENKDRKSGGRGKATKERGRGMGSGDYRSVGTEKGRTSY